MKRTFTFYRTFYERLPKNTPVTVGFENVTPSLLRKIEGFKSVYLHSGNWWRIEDRKRTAENIFNSYVKLKKVCHVDAIMGINVPPKRVRKTYDIWNYPTELREQALKESLERTIRLKELVGNEVPIYFSYEVGTFEEAVKWYKLAFNKGFRYFGAGFGAFLMYRPSYENYKHMIDVIVGAKYALGVNTYFHASGVGSLKLLLLLFYLGVNSADGSTPIRAALSYGFVYDENGKSHRVRDLKEWSCTCAFCSQYSSSELVRMFKEDYTSRVLHNSFLWDLIIDRMIEAYEEGVLEEFIYKFLKDSKLLLKVYEYARRMKRKYLKESS